MGCTMKTSVYVCLLLLFGSCLAGLIYLDKAQGDAMYSVIKRDELSIPIYDSSSSDAEVNIPKDFIVDNIDTEYKEIHIAFDFRIDGITEYNNLFQTADANNGLRMELSQPNKLWLLTGLRSDPPNDLVGFEIGSDIELDKWYQIKIDVSKYHMVEITLDDNIVFRRITDKMKLEVSNIAVGTGFSRSRLFEGGIKDFSIEYIIYKPRDLTMMWNIGKIGLTLISLLLTFFILFPAQLKKSLPDSK